jgi:hypothetical protein
MADHRRSMRALRKVSAAAASEAERTAPARVSTAGEVDAAHDNVTSLAAARARRSGHPAGSARAR